MNEGAGRDEKRLAGQRTSFEGFQIVPEHEHDVVNDFLRKIYRCSVDRYGAEIEKWLKVGVPRVIDWVIRRYQKWEKLRAL